MPITPRTIIFIALFNLSIGIGLVAGNLLGDWNTGLYEYLVRSSRMTEHVAVESGGINDEGQLVMIPYDYTPSPVIPLIRMDREAASNAFATIPPEPMDWAVLFHQLQSYRVGNLLISAPLVWKDTSNKLVSMALVSHLKNFSHVTIGKPVMLSTRGSQLPGSWKRLALKENQYAGDLSGIPVANRLYGEDSLTLQDCVTAPSQIENDELFIDPGSGNMSQPLFIMWNNELLPTSALTSALTSLGLDQTQIHVHFGDRLRLGDKVTLPIDNAGRIPLRPDAEPYVLTPAEIIILSDNIALTARQKEIAPILEASPVSIISEPFNDTKGIAPSSILSAKTISSLLAGIAPGTPVLCNRLSTPLIWVLFVDLSVISLWALRFPALIRWSLLTLSFLLVLGAAVYFLYGESIWIPVVTLVFTWLTVCLASFFVKPSVSQDDDGDDARPEPAAPSVESFDFNEPNEIPIPRKKEETKN